MAPALKGAAEICFTVLSISVSLIAVFLPILLMGRHCRTPVPRIRRDALGPILVPRHFLTTTPMMCARPAPGP